MTISLPDAAAPDHKPLRVLVVEDSAVDTGLIIRELEHHGYRVDWTRVDTAPALRAALTNQPLWDVVLSDFAMPQFSGLEALEIVKASGYDLPFIIISGTIGEETAVEAMRLGAHDYLLKDRLARLGLAVERALSDAAERRAHQQSEEARRASEARFSVIFHASPVGISITRLYDGLFIEANDALLTILGYTREELIGHSSLELSIWVNPDERDDLIHLARTQGRYRDLEPTFRKKSGEIISTLASGEVIDFAGEPCLLGLTHDITERKQAEEEIRKLNAELEQRVEDRTAQLQRVKENIEAILNSTSDILILCRTDGTIEQVNPAFEMTFQCEPDEAFLQPLTQFVSPQHVPMLEEAFNAVVETRQPARLEVTAHCKQGALFDADMILSPIVRSDDQLSGIVCSLRDITERKQMEVRLRQMLAHEMKLGELKSRYVSMAAHDLRNPLAVIQSAIDIVRQYGDRLTDEQKQVRYNAARMSIRVMVDLLDDILTIGQVESGKLTFNPAPLDVLSFCQSIAAETTQVNGITRQIDFSSEGDCGIALMDAKLLRHILSNLLSNGIKYSPDEKPVTFTVSCEPDQITFCIQDQGIGIPKEDQAQLFEAFHRASNARQVPGTGLGLAIVKQSVDLHGGTITFTSEEGVGTTFTVSLPQAQIGK